MTANSVWDEIESASPDACGIEIADDLRAMARAYDAGSQRSAQRDLGPSQIGMDCVRCLARMSIGVELFGDRVHTDPWCRIIGTATHAWLDQAARAANGAVGGQIPRWLPEYRVWPDDELLPSGGSADLYDVKRAAVLDHKIVGAPQQRKYRVHGPSNQYRIQAHLYGYGYVRAGLPVQRVAIAFWQRGGRLSDLYVWTEAYSDAVAAAALARYKTIRDTARALGPAVLDHLPADDSCFECGGGTPDNTTQHPHHHEKGRRTP